jgi:RNA polymerase sigma-70 factor (ECF subfamily)
MTAAIMSGVSRRAASSNNADGVAAELFAGHYARLAGWCRRLVDDDETAHEFASEAFARLLTRLNKIDDPVGYLYVITANLVRDHWRRTSRERKALRLEANALSGPADEASGSVEIRDLVDALPDRLRVPVLLHYFADFSVREVSRLTGRPEGTVKSDLFAARSALRSAMGSTHG